MRSSRMRRRRRSDQHFCVQIGEKFDVFLPSDDRSVSVEVLSNTPRLLVVPNFLSPSECYEIMEEAKPLMKRSTVLRQGDQSKVGSFLGMQ